jgi:hypothetical protein
MVKKKRPTVPTRVAKKTNQVPTSQSVAACFIKNLLCPEQDIVRVRVTVRVRVNVKVKLSVKVGLRLGLGLRLLNHSVFPNIQSLTLFLTLTLTCVHNKTSSRLIFSISNSRWL